MVVTLAMLLLSVPFGICLLVYLWQEAGHGYGGVEFPNRRKWLMAAMTVLAMVAIIRIAERLT